MTTTPNFPAALDAFFKAPKRIVGADSAPTWAQGFVPHEEVMKYPLEVNGEQTGAQLMIVRFRRQQGLKFRLGILAPAMVSRVDYTDETHSNTLEGVRQHNLLPLVKGPHYHPWDLNKRFFRSAGAPTRLHDAVPLPCQSHSFDGVLRWFCAEVNIVQLPSNHAIDLSGIGLLL